MAQSFSTLDAVYRVPFDTVIDVRSPAEFAEDHIPGAMSLPVLSNEQRAEVGTTYTQISPFKARKIGATLVARNAADHIAGPLADFDGGWKPLVYCWRGGQRSGSFASILSQIGWRADVIEGGYRSYRRLVVSMLHETELPHKLVLLDGNTGTAKTEILNRLSQRGVQTIDLEGLACHRGSLFGSVATPQPSQKAFETALAKSLTLLDPNKVTVVEAESSKVGNLIVPPSLWAIMTRSPRIKITAPLAARARYLTSAYADMVEDPKGLATTLNHLVPYHGHAQVTAWQQMAIKGGFETLAAELMERHYDSRYAKSRGSKNRVMLETIALSDLAATDLDFAVSEVLRAL